MFLLKFPESIMQFLRMLSEEENELSSCDQTEVVVSTNGHLSSTLGTMELCIRGVCMCFCHRHSRIAARAAAVGGRVRCHDLLYIQHGCVMQFGAKRCAQRARRGCIGHDGRAKSAWAARTRPIGAPHSVRRSRVPTSLIY
jgi:hypothetical protein